MHLYLVIKNISCTFVRVLVLTIKRRIMTLTEFRKETKGMDGNMEIYIANGDIEAAGGGTPLFRSDGVNFINPNDYDDDGNKIGLGTEILVLSFFDRDFISPEFLSDDRVLEVETEREEI